MLYRLRQLHNQYMKNVVIVGVEGSGKTVLLACLGEHYKKPDADGYFLKPKDFETIAYTSSIVARLHEGVWSSATAEDSFVDLSWQLCHSAGPEAPATQQGGYPFSILLVRSIGRPTEAVVHKTSSRVRM